MNEQLPPDGTSTRVVTALTEAGEVARLACELAHDLPNLLTIVIASAEVALIDLGPEHPVRDMIEEVRKAGNIANTMIRRFQVRVRALQTQPTIIVSGPPT